MVTVKNNKVITNVVDEAVRLRTDSEPYIETEWMDYHYGVLLEELSEVIIRFRNIGDKAEVGVELFRDKDQKGITISFSAETRQVTLSDTISKVT